MHSFKKRLVAILLTLAMAISFSATAFAAEPTKVDTFDPAPISSEEVSTRASLGDVIAAGATTIYGGSGSLSVYLSSGNFWADIVAQIDYAPQSGIVSVSVVTPNGDFINLGDISGSGSRTYSYELAYAPAGTYTFSFYTAITSGIDVSARIYD